MKKIETVAIVGMGALGLLYGDHIVKTVGQDAVSFVMDKERVEKYQNADFTINGNSAKFQVVATEDATPVDLLIVAVKYTGLKTSLDVMKNCIDENTTIISVLNGISSEEIIGAQGMDAMKFGNSLNFTQMGALHIGALSGQDSTHADRVRAYFDEIKMPYVWEEDILYRMWSKFMLNVGVNHTCMVYETNYAGACAKGDANRTMIAAMREVVAIANAKGIALGEKEINQYVNILKTLSPEGVPSMAQDRINKKASEVEMFAGDVIKIAAQYDIYVPENVFLYDKVAEIESAYVQ